MLLYGITVENSDTGDREGWLWNVTAASPEDALTRSDAQLRALGWPAGWRSTVATLVSDGLQLNTTDKAIVDFIEPGTPEWDVSEAALERQRKAGG
jgi:hypothetical protein